MLIFKNLNKSYQNQVIYQNFNLNLPNQGLIGLFGKSGSGKSTLLNLIGGLDKPDSGEIFFNDTELTSLNKKDKSNFIRNNIGFIFQDYQLIDNKTVYENIKMGLSFSGYLNQDVNLKIKEIAKSLNIKHLLNKTPNKLSGGEKQRVSVARALVKDPEIILADEPTGAIDLKEANNLMEILKDISKDKLVIIASHDISLLNNYCNILYSLDSLAFKKEDKIKSHIKTLNLDKRKIKFKTLFNYSFKNLIGHYLRSLLLLLTLVISLVGISSSYHFNNALNLYINENDQNITKIFPIEIDTLSLSLDVDNTNYDYLPSYDYVIPGRIQSLFYYLNKLDLNFYEYINQMNIDDLDQITYIFDLKYNFFKQNNGEFSKYNLKIEPLSKSDDLLLEEYDILYQNDNNGDINLTLILDKYNRINYQVLEELGIDLDNTPFDTFNNLELYYFENNYLYEKNNDDSFSLKNFQTLNTNNSKKVVINRIVRQKESFELYSLHPGLYLSNQDYLNIYFENLNSEIVTEQLTSNQNLFSGNSFNDENEKDNLLKSLGYFYYPNSYRISTKTKDAKKLVLEYIKNYPNDEVIPLDKGELGLQAAKSAFDLFSLLGNGFIIISLISGIFIIILSTYLSIIEKVRELGILKTLGANSLNISLIFTLELFIISIIASVISFVTTSLLIPLFNNIIIQELKAPHIFNFQIN
ncbi:MAG: ATP-binding cassette domain-containing protein, partial [Acholeplasmataceae bacterium]